jgi:ABC-type sugar transport system ATPase subunit
MSADQDRSPNQSTAWLDQSKQDSGFATVQMSESVNGNVDTSVEHWSPLEAQRRGIAVMHQHPGLFPDLTVFENIFIGHMPHGSLGVDFETMRERTARLLGIVGLSCRPEDTLKRLRTSEQQLVEIARALSVNAKVLIMDEPDSSPREARVANKSQLLLQPFENAQNGNGQAL